MAIEIKIFVVGVDVREYCPGTPATCRCGVNAWFSSSKTKDEDRLGCVKFRVDFLSEPAPTFYALYNIVCILLCARVLVLICDLLF